MSTAVPPATGGRLALTARVPLVSGPGFALFALVETSKIGDAIDLAAVPGSALLQSGARAAPTPSGTSGPLGTSSASLSEGSVASVFPPSRSPERFVRFDLGRGDAREDYYYYCGEFDHRQHGDSLLEEVESLIWPQGAELEARDKNGMTALALAAKYGMARRAQALLAAGAKVETEDDQGYTPLCWVSLFHLSADLPPDNQRGVGG